MECYRALGVESITVDISHLAPPHDGTPWPSIPRYDRGRMSATELEAASGKSIAPNVAALWGSEEYHCRVAQKSPEWHALRRQYITGSRVGGILRLHSYRNSTPEGIMRGYWQPDADGFRGSAATRWGERFEDVAIFCYEQWSDDFVLPFDFIRSTDPNHTHRFALSPDGITASGRLIEVKCPYSRPIIEGAYPPHYICGQVLYSLYNLRTAGITECDYIEFDPRNNIMHVARVHYTDEWAEKAVDTLVSFHTLMQLGFSKGEAWCDQKLEEMADHDRMKKAQCRGRSERSKRARLWTWGECLSADYDAAKAAYEKENPPPSRLAERVEAILHPTERMLHEMDDDEI